MQIATYVDGRTVDYDEQSRVFSIGGMPVTVEQVISYDRASQLAWLSGDLRNWVYQFGASVGPASVAVVARPAAPGSGFVLAGGILAAFGVVVVVISTPWSFQDGISVGVLLAAIGLYAQAVGVLRPSKMGWGGMTAFGLLVCFSAVNLFDLYFFLYYLGSWGGHLSQWILGAGVLLAAIGLTMQFVSVARRRKLTAGIVTALGVLICAIALVPGVSFSPGLVNLGVLFAAVGFAMHVIGEVGYKRVAGQVYVASGLLACFASVVVGSLGSGLTAIMYVGSGLGLVLAVVGFVMQIRGTSSSPQPV